MGISKSQYNGTLKDSRCTRCGKNMNNKTRIEMDVHAEECIKQEKLEF